jgi:hypothetical protein
LYETEREAYDRGENTDRNLMTQMVRASHDAAKTSTGLTEREIYGNSEYP